MFTEIYGVLYMSYQNLVSGGGSIREDLFVKSQYTSQLFHTSKLIKVSTVWRRYLFLKLVKLFRGYFGVEDL